MRFLRLNFIVLAVAAGLALAAVSAAHAEVAAPSSIDSLLVPEVRRIFERSCADCHDVGHRSKPKGGFGHVLDLGRLVREEIYLKPGEAEKSDLYLVLVDDDLEVLMPPPDSDVPKLTPEEIQKVHSWITSLAAVTPNAAVVPPLAMPALPSKAAEPAPARVLDPEPAPVDKPLPTLARVFARTHPMVVHFPIALLIVAAMADWLGVFARRQKEWLPVVRWMLVISSLSAVFAITAGWMLAEQEGYKPATVFLHRWLGVATAVVSWVGWGLLEWAERTGSRRLRWAARVLILLGAVLVSVTGHTGGELVYGAGYPFTSK